MKKNSKKVKKCIQPWVTRWKIHCEPSKRIHYNKIWVHLDKTLLPKIVIPKEVAGVGEAPKEVDLHLPLNQYEDVMKLLGVK